MNPGCTFLGPYPGGCNSATGAIAKLRLSQLKSSLKIDCGPKELENARFFRGLGPLELDT
jgi:hypothetical protein